MYCIRLWTVRRYPRVSIQILSCQVSLKINGHCSFVISEILQAPKFLKRKTPCLVLTLYTRCITFLQIGRRRLTRSMGNSSLWPLDCSILDENRGKSGKHSLVGQTLHHCLYYVPSSIRQWINFIDCCESLVGVRNHRAGKTDWRSEELQKVWFWIYWSFQKVIEDCKFTKFFTVNFF